jgi:hypothetical protein
MKMLLPLKGKGKAKLIGELMLRGRHVLLVLQVGAQQQHEGVPRSGLQPACTGVAVSHIAYR